jgi:hypothetical protein
MSIKDAIKDAIKGEEKSDAEDALRRYEEANDKVKELDAVQTTKRQELYTIESKLEDAALLADTKPYDALKARIAKIEEELERNGRAQKAAGRARDQAADDLHKAKAADIIKQARKYNNARTRAAELMAEGIAKFYAGWSEFHTTSEKLATFGGPALQANGGYGGLAVIRQDIANVAVQELSRVSAPQVLDNKAVPGLPGSRVMALSGNRARLRKRLRSRSNNRSRLSRMSNRPNNLCRLAPRSAPIRS